MEYLSGEASFNRRGTLWATKVIFVDYQKPVETSSTDAILTALFGLEAVTVEAHAMICEYSLS